MLVKPYFFGGQMLGFARRAIIEFFDKPLRKMKMLITY